MITSAKLEPDTQDVPELAYAKRIVTEIVDRKNELGISTAQLAEQVSAASGEKVNPTTLNNILAGKRKSITVGELIAYCKVLSINPIEMLPELNDTSASHLRDRYRKELIAELSSL